MDAAFHDFEQQGWERAADYYGDAFGSLTSQTIPSLLGAVGAGAGMRLLDVASGPGYVAAAAAELGVSAVGVDFSSEMVALSGLRYPSITFVEGDAEALAFPDRSFDAVAINFGVLHLARPDAALSEARRVLVPGGRCAFTVWATPDISVGFGIVLKAI
jgi:ubiquinone/menaquinone biosynthesis C-methylase UbiE